MRPDLAEQRALVGGLLDRARRTVASRLDAESRWLDDVRRRPALHDPAGMILVRRTQEVADLVERSMRSMLHRVDRADDDLHHVVARVRALSPAATLDRGYSLVQAADGRVVRDEAEVGVGDDLRVRLAHGEFPAVGSLTALQWRHALRKVRLRPRRLLRGVDRAVVTVEKALDLYGPPVYVRKQIVQNRYVVESLEARGAVFVEELEEVPAGSTVVFSAHGVAPSVHEEAAERELRTIDATCPLVTKVHAEARRFAADGFRILLIGHEGHEEVVGTMGEAPDRITLVDSPEHAADVEIASDEPVVWLSQTTLSVDETLLTVDRLKERRPDLMSPPSDDICYATQNRQAAVKAIAHQCDVLVVVGSGNSSNSVRLVEVALEAGARASYRIDSAAELMPEWFEGATTVGLTSGASVPELLVREVLEWLSAAGFGDVEEVATAEETLVFALPPELRRDMKRANATT